MTRVVEQPDHRVYVLAPGVDTVPLDDGTVVFRSDTLAVHIEGASAGILVDRILPLLDGQRTLRDVADQLPEISGADLRRHLDAIVEAGILRLEEAPPSGSPDNRLPASFRYMLQSLGLPVESISRQIASASVVIFGMEGAGAHLASLLAQCGVGRVLLVDPYPCLSDDLSLMPPLPPGSVGRLRHEVIRDALERQETVTTVDTGNDEELTREAVSSFVEGSQLVVACFDKALSAANHWINRACLEKGIPALYASAKGHGALVGPLVVPGQTACYMCYRMRSIATESDFQAAMGYEEFLNRSRRPALHSRPVFPAIPTYMAAQLATETLKLLGVGQPRLAGMVHEYNALSLQTEMHPVLRQPDCPVCGGSNPGRRNPSLDEMRDETPVPGDLRQAEPWLVSPRTGIVRDLRPVEKDVSEPTLPVVLRAEIANHRFLSEESRDQRLCSGKGMTIEDAKVSALGEAVERYSAGCWAIEEVTYGRRQDMTGDTMDPTELVLYQPDQYRDLPYDPWDGENILGWVDARSLVTGNTVRVPAIAVFMNYAVQGQREYLCPITSNGLAAGPTLPQAILAATCEVLERDAFLATWFHRLPTTHRITGTHPDRDTVRLCEAYRRRGVEIELFRLPTDHPCHVFLALGVQRSTHDGPAVVAGLGADLSPERAARKAIHEVAQIRPALRRRLRHPETQRRLTELVEDPRRVTTLDDHDLLYADPATTGTFDFLLDQPQRDDPWDPADESPDRKLHRLVDWFGSQDQDLLYVDLTPPDMAPFGLHTARVIAPGFQPIHFGWNETRLGGRRLHEMPQRLSLQPIGLPPGQLNDAPHPLA